MTRLEPIIGTILADFFGFNIQQIKIEACWTGIRRTPRWIGRREIGAGAAFPIEMTLARMRS